MPNRRNAACCLLVSGAIIVSGCGISDARGVDTASARLDGTEAVAESDTASIEIRRFTFSTRPSDFTGPGDLGIVNADGVAHEIVADDGSFKTRRLDPGEQATLHTTSGVAFHCVIHPNMTGET